MHVGIVGTGLIGASIGMGLVAKGHRVIGFDLNRENLEKARNRNCLSETGSLSEVAVAEVVFCAVPPAHVCSTLRELFKFVGPDTVVTDCTSVKQSVLDFVRAELGSPENFVGGHPMAGHEKSGPAFATQWMFRGAKWILTPSEFSAAWAVNRLEVLLGELDAEVLRIDSVTHDHHVALLSHLPHILAALLVTEAKGLERPEIGGGSWKDLTRVGGVDPELWTQILSGNQAELTQTLANFEAGISTVRGLLESGDDVGLRAFLVQAERLKAQQLKASMTKFGAKDGKGK